ncbi:MAG TPA: hypothetical protein VHB74_00495 [Devosia sp.]|nr:hypothetical protein [Devosia sp.]
MIAQKLLAALGAGLLLTSVAHAAPDFTHTDCASPAFKAFIAAHLGHGKLTGTDRLSPDRFNYGPIVSATTVTKSATSISCTITVNRDGPRGMHLIHGRFTATRNGWKWLPAY